MAWTDSKVKEIWGRKFKIAKNGLDEADVFSFIGNLIEQNNQYAVKLENLSSLTQLAESTVIEANKQAQKKSEEIERETHETATAMICEAEVKAKTEADAITAEAIAKAKADAELIVAQAEENATQIKGESARLLAEAEASAQAKVSTAEEQSQESLEKARKEAAGIRSLAEEEAAKIALAARQEAEESAVTIGAAAEEHRQNLLSKAEEDATAIRERAESELQSAKREAAQLLQKSKQIAESEIRKTFGRIYNEMISTLELEGAGETAAGAMDPIPALAPPQDGDVEMPVADSADSATEEKLQKPGSEQAGAECVPEAEATACTQQETLTDKPAVDQDTGEQQERGSEEGGHPLYEGMVELQVPAPLVFDRLLELHKDLRRIPEVKETNLTPPTDNGVTIELRLSSPIPLLKILGELPEVKKALHSPDETKEAGHRRRARSKQHYNRIVVTTKE